LIKKQYEGIVVCFPYIDELITFDKKEGLKGLKRIKHDLREQRFLIFTWTFTKTGGHVTFVFGCMPEKQPLTGS